ncbi:MAG: porin family protein [Phreatobacter sp.]|nr:porin family protein [Phreatobacter sp.]
MKKVLIASVAILGFATAAQAADLGSPRMPIAGAVMAPAFNWSGFYLGGQVGGVWFNDRTREFITATGIATGFNQGFNTGGITGGIHAGVNYQINNFVLGVEGDIEASGVSGGYTLPGGIGTRFRSNFQGSLRLRGGIAVDRALFYVTGGLAVAQMRYGYFTPAIIENFTRTQAGWTVGAGVEYAFTPNWTARLEYRYSDYGRVSNASLVAFPGFTYRHNPRSHAVRVGVTYLFSTGPSAVVARY